ncbi:SDR family oxidoreductase [Nakamurella antarctica]|uniref:SDR family oxidoreductase n=1 Tax=Nakamurella antarctica TaxID=1902245 RepID=A0A3G8ZQS5_9ACTN|nr:SDR family NAD(P)-dependent oxidoreductase [Nakamurella antarctica]AZI56904.1 SDR family oxidoreductase [Nakamurella antarctica]
MSTVLVAGGATGIGAAAVRAFRERGDRVLLADLNEPHGSALVAEAGNGAAKFFQCDFADPAAVHDAVEATASFGGGIDVVFYNAGILQASPLAEWTPAQWNKSLAVNLTAPFFLVQAAAPYLRTSDHGRVILTSSTGAFRGHAGMPAYHATKAGLLGLVRSLADELGPDGITVNALCPGWIDTAFNDAFWGHQADPAAALSALTAQIPLGRQAEAADVTGLLLFLASPGSAYITGQPLVIDGGYTAV